MRSRRIASVLFVVALLACSDGGSDSPSTTASVESPGRVVPEVVCTESFGGAFGVAYFGYANDGDVPVAVPVGPANAVTGPDGSVRTTSQTGVFAPGRQGVVFWTGLDGAGDSVTWTIVGEDGEPRSVAATLDPAAPSPTCPGGVPPLDPPDDRTATFATDVEVTRDGAGTVVGATITISLTGLPEASRCPSGSHPWTADPPQVRLISEGSLNATEVEQPDGAVVRLFVDDPHTPVQDQQRIEGFAAVNVAADIDDRCHDENGATSSAWAASDDLRALSQGTRRLCFGLEASGDGQTFVAVDCSLGPTLALTGGFRIR